MKKLFLKENRKQLLIVLASIALVNSFLSHFFTGVDILMSLGAMFISFPILAFIIGSIIAAFPFGKLNFQDRWLASSFVTLFIIQCLFVLSNACIVIFAVIGWRH